MSKEVATIVATLNDEQADALTAALNARRNAKKPAPKPIEDNGVRISAILEEDRRDAPNASEERRLLAVVGTLFPKVSAALHAEPEAFERFQSALRLVFGCGRIEPDRKRYLSSFIDEAKPWFQARMISPSRLRGPDLLLAAIAAGDVDYIPADERIGQLWELGLSLYGGRDRPRLPGAWRDVLAGRPRKPLPPRASSWDPNIRRSGVAL